MMNRSYDVYAHVCVVWKCVFRKRSACRRLCILYTCCDNIISTEQHTLCRGLQVLSTANLSTPPYSYSRLLWTSHYSHQNFLTIWSVSSHTWSSHLKSIMSGFVFNVFEHSAAQLCVNASTLVFYTTFHVKLILYITNLNF